MLDRATGIVADELRRLTRRLDPAQRLDDRKPVGRESSSMRSHPTHATRGLVARPTGPRVSTSEARWGTTETTACLQRAAGLRVRSAPPGQASAGQRRPPIAVRGCLVWRDAEYDTLDGVPPVLPTSRRYRRTWVATTRAPVVSPVLATEGLPSRAARACASRPACGDVVPGRRPPGARA
jgi:hypothetical protein